MWDPPRPGMKSTSPAFAGRCFTPEPPGEPQVTYQSHFSSETSSLLLLLHLWSLRRPAAELWSWDWLLPSSWLSSPSPCVRFPISWILRRSFPQGYWSLVACLYLRVEAMPLHRDWQGKDWLHIMSQTLLSPCGLKAKWDSKGKKYKHIIINMEYRCGYSIPGITVAQGKE